MNGRDLAGIALRVWGIMLLLSALVTVPGLAVMVSAVPSPSDAAAIRASQTASMLGVGLNATLGLFLVLCGGWVADSVIPETPRLELGGDGVQLQPLGFALVGVFILVGGLQDTGAVVFLILSKPDWAELGKWEFVWQRQPDALIRALVELVSGALLVVGRDVIARGWTRLRKGGGAVERGHEAGGA